MSSRHRPSLLIQGRPLGAPGSSDDEADAPTFTVEEPQGGDDTRPGVPRFPTQPADTEWSAVYVPVVDLRVEDMQELLVPREGGLLPTDDVKRELSGRYALSESWTSFCPHSDCHRHKLRVPAATPHHDKKFNVGFDEDADDDAVGAGAGAGAAAGAGSGAGLTYAKEDVIDEHFSSPAPGHMFSLMQGSTLEDVFSLLQYRNGSAHNLSLHARNRDRIEDDVDLLVFYLEHCHAPIAQALLFAHQYSSFVLPGCTTSVSREKAAFFSLVAQRLTASVPVGRLYEFDRSALLGPTAGHPVELGLRYRNVAFIVTPAVQQFVNEVWGSNQFASFKLLLLMTAHPFLIFCQSFQARRSMYIASEIMYVVFMWVMGHRASKEGFENKPLTSGEVLMYLFALSHTFSEIGEWADHVATARDHYGSQNAHLVVKTGTIRHFILNPWNLVDVLASLTFIAMFIIHVSNMDHRREHAYQLLVFLIVAGCLRLLHMFEMHRVLGPLVRSVANMAVDIVVFLALFFVVLLGFAAAFTILYRDVPGEDGSSGAYSSYSESMLTLWQASLGEFDYSAHEKAFSKTSNTIGTILLTTHITLSHIILLNLLVAFLAATWDRFRDHAHDEYLFGRARSVLGFTRAVSTRALPPPLPLLQVVVWIMWRVTKMCINCCWPRRGKDRARKLIRRLYCDTCNWLMVLTYWLLLVVCVGCIGVLMLGVNALLKVLEAAARLALTPLRLRGPRLCSGRARVRSRDAAFEPRDKMPERSSIRQVARRLHEKSQFFVAKPRRPKRVYLILDTDEDGHSNSSCANPNALGTGDGLFTVDNITKCLRQRVQLYNSGTPPLRLFAEQPELRGKYIMNLSWLRVVSVTLRSLTQEVMETADPVPPSITSTDDSMSDEWRHLLAQVLVPLRLLSKRVMQNAAGRVAPNSRPRGASQYDWNPNRDVGPAATLTQRVQWPHASALVTSSSAAQQPRPPTVLRTGGTRPGTAAQKKKEHQESENKDGQQLGAPSTGGAANVSPPTMRRSASRNQLEALKSDERGQGFF